MAEENNSIDLVEEAANKTPDTLAWAKDESANTELESNPGDFLQIPEKSMSALVAFAAALVEKEIPLSGKQTIALKALGYAPVPLSITVNLASGDNDQRAILKAILNLLQQLEVLVR